MEVTWEEVPYSAIETYREICKEVEGMEEKQAYSMGLRRLLELGNYSPGEYFAGIPNSPGPLTGMLTSGLLGAGLGYGAGVIGEKVLPASWKRGKLRRTLTMLGAAAGAAPGLIYMGANYANGKPLLSNSLMDNPRPTEPGYPTNGEAIVKEALLESQTGAGIQPVNVNEFNQVVWGDPRVSQQIPVNTRAAASGLLAAAAEAKGSPIVTPLDIGRITVGMGTGYLSGALVGKGLGALMGMPESTQDVLKSVGMWAGVVRELVPMAFGA